MKVRRWAHICAVIQEVAITVCDLLRQLLLFHLGQQPSFFKLEVRSSQASDYLLIHR